jgi:hypothetical protein
MYTLRQSSTSRPLMFLMVDNTDHISPKTGLSPTVQISKNGGAFASPSGAVTEIGNGWYRVAGNATDTNTLGVLTLRATATGADPCDVVYEVVAFDPHDAAGLGLTRIDAAITTRSTLTAADVWGHATRSLTTFGTLIADIWSHSTRSLTTFGTLVTDIWSHSTRSLTTFGTLISDIWTNAIRTLSSGGNKAVWDINANIGFEDGSIGEQIAGSLDATISSARKTAAQSGFIGFVKQNESVASRRTACCDPPRWYRAG